MENIIELVEKTIRDEGRYLKAKELVGLIGISLYTIYRCIPEGLLEVNNRLGFNPIRLFTKEAMEDEIRAFIYKTGHFCSGNFIDKNSNLNRQTIRKLGIDIYALNSELEFTTDKQTPNSSGINAGTRKPRFNKEQILDLAKEHSLRLGKCIKIRELAKILGTNPGNIYHQVSSTELVEFYKSYPSTHSLNFRIDTKEEMILKASAIIKSLDYYCTTAKLSNELGVPASLLSFKGVSVKDLNKSLGFSKVNNHYESEVGRILGIIFPTSKINTQKWFNDCRSDLDRPLFFDFYIEDENLIVEADSDYHNKLTHPWHSTKTELRDKQKDDYCLAKGITLVRIPYRSIITVDYISQYLPGKSLETEALQHKEKS